MYSTIKKKLCKCGCGKPPTISFSGFNYLCAPDEIKEKVLNKRLKQKKESAKRQLDKSKVRSLINSKDDEKLKKQHELNEWFKYQMDNSPMKCENCGQRLAHYSKKDWRSCQDHIIEKSEINGCPSVAAELDNHCVLGLWCGCHGQKHTSHENLSKMDIFPLLKERFKKFGHLIAAEERRKIPNIFLI